MVGVEWLWWLPVLLAGVLLWQHDRISRRAYRVAREYTNKQGLALLDQSVVLKSLRPRLSPRDGVHLQRRFEFEFSTRGDVRYKGSVWFRGQHLHSVHLDPYKPPEEAEH